MILYGVSLQCCFSVILLAQTDDFVPTQTMIGQQDFSMTNDLAQEAEKSQDSDVMIIDEKLVKQDCDQPQELSNTADTSIESIQVDQSLLENCKTEEMDPKLIEMGNELFNDGVLYMKDEAIPDWATNMKYMVELGQFNSTGILKDLLLLFLIIPRSCLQLNELATEIVKILKECKPDSDVTNDQIKEKISNLAEWVNYGGSTEQGILEEV